MNDNVEFRTQVLIDFGATALETAELLNYNQNHFEWNFTVPIELPLTDEPFVKTWQQYVTESQTIGAFQVLQKKLVQLTFPIQAGISQTNTYQEATRKGIKTTPEKIGLILQQPDQVQLSLYSSLAGRIPIIYTPNRHDFISLVQALARKNEPQPIPHSMGACLVSGFNNWDRIHRYRQQWESENLLLFSEQKWSQEFQKLIPQKHLYQDRFIILSASPYSNISANKFGLSDIDWQTLSYIIRLEHECFHYLSRRLFNSMQNNLLDELIADYWGLVMATGKYKADWFLHFMGLENFPDYREGGRLQNYKGNPPLSEVSFSILQRLVKTAIENLATYSSQLTDINNHLVMVMGLSTLTLEELASASAQKYLEKAFKKVRKLMNLKNLINPNLTESNALDSLNLEYTSLSPPLLLT